MKTQSKKKEVYISRKFGIPNSLIDGTTGYTVIELFVKEADENLFETWFGMIMDLARKASQVIDNE